MKKRMLLSWIVFWMLIVSTWAQGLLVTGIVKDKETRKALANVNVSVEGSNIGTVTNTDGVFSLKVSQEELGRGVIVSHLGYQNVFLTSDVLNSSSKRPTIWMTPTSFTLDMVKIRSNSWRRPCKRFLRTMQPTTICSRLSIAKPFRRRSDTSVYPKPYSMPTRPIIKCETFPTTGYRFFEDDACRAKRVAIPWR